MQQDVKPSPIDRAQDHSSRQTLLVFTDEMCDGWVSSLFADIRASDKYVLVGIVAIKDPLSKAAMRTCRFVFSSLPRISTLGCARAADLAAQMGLSLAERVSGPESAVFFGGSPEMQGFDCRTPLADIGVWLSRQPAVGAWRSFLKQALVYFTFGREYSQDFRSVGRNGSLNAMRAIELSLLISTVGTGGARLLDRAWCSRHATRVREDTKNLGFQARFILQRRIGAGTLFAMTSRVEEVNCSAEAENGGRNDSFVAGPSLVRRLREKIRNPFYVRPWVLGVSEFSDSWWTGQHFRPLFPPTGYQWADPFVIQRGGRHFVFLEEIPPGSRRAHISVAPIQAGATHIEASRVLAQDTHLSYPFVFEHRGEIFMVPETKQRQRVELYRARHFPEEWEPVEVLLDKIRAADATLLEYDDCWWMFVAVGGEHTRCDCDLMIFYADRLSGPWKPHPQNPVKSDSRSARPAGRLRFADGKLYRPAQDCSLSYGGALVMNEVLRLTRSEYRERICRCIEPSWFPGISRMHTINSAGGLTLTDGKARITRLAQSLARFRPNASR